MSEGDDYRYEQSTEQTLNQGKSRELMDMIFLAPRSFKRHIRLTPIAGFAFPTHPHDGSSRDEGRGTECVVSRRSAGPTMLR
jgi:hypothetical protein